MHLFEFNQDEVTNICSALMYASEQLKRNDKAQKAEKYTVLANRIASLATGVDVEMQIVETK